LKWDGAGVHIIIEYGKTVTFICSKTNILTKVYNLGDSAFYA